MTAAVVRAVVAMLALLGAQSALAAEIKVLVTGAFKPIVIALAPAFEQRTGNKVVVDNGTAGQIAKRVADGEAFDVAIITPAANRELAEAGKLRADTLAPVARVGIGVVIREGAKPPDISSLAAFRQTLLDAKSVSYIDPASGGSSGVYFDKLLQKMGIANEVRAKAVLVPGGYVAERVRSGQAEIGIHQISEIIPVSGTSLVGPIPAEVQNFTVYAAGLSTRSANPAAAADFLSTLRGPDAAALLKTKGMELP